jgi:rhamnose utilization protein RhaD (predicted bifunctional aldolase and dehydrogenase)
MIALRLRQRPADVIVLGNHGLVVGAESVEAADRLLREVERRLEAPVRAAPAGDRAALAQAAAELGLRVVKHDRAHMVATDRQRMLRAIAGSLYPDHVIFLGPAAGTVPGEPAEASKLFILPGAGVLLSPDTTHSADELALCLALVLERVSKDAELCYLDAADVADLLDWDAEKYRQSLARARR